MNKRMIFFRYLSYFFWILANILVLYDVIVKKYSLSVFVMCIVCVFVAWITTYIGWRCPVCKKRLPIRANIKLEKCSHCGIILNEMVKVEQKSESQIIKEYDEIMTKLIYNITISAFLIVFSTFLNLFTYGLYIWLGILAMVGIYNIYFFLTKNRCPNCHHLFIPKHDFNLVKCPYCGIKLRK